ncbi:C39 family peptidase [Oceanobacillus halotolerans]|uniref:C39 family peptidase n=1 Tax=Oceanobacillus halotolerans TaxID=2663380 RepID=UPI0013DD289C|nr:C39 family peptidase [Oceanobacillus halotolerans]
MKRILLISLFIIVAFISFFLTRKKGAATTYQVKGVPTYYQYPELPTGCEATSLAMLLSWGSGDGKVSKYDVVEKLPKGDKVHEENGELRGANPDVEFVGDPYGDGDSFGVFEGPILETIEKFMPGKGVNLTGKEFEDLLDIVRSGKPVMAWTTIEQKETYHSDTWTDRNGNTIKWYTNEHAVVITGIDGDNVLVHDPHTGKAEAYNRGLFEKNWVSMGKRAVTLDVPPETK